MADADKAGAQGSSLPAGENAMADHVRYFVLAMLFLAGALNYLDRQIIAVLKPLLQRELGWSDGDYGQLTALFQMASAFAFLGAGWLVDRIGWRRAGWVSVGSWSLAALGHGVVQGIGQFSVVRLALGATEALGTPSMIKTTAALFRAEHRSLAIGVINVSNNIGAVATPLIVPFVAVTYGWRAAFMLAGGLGLLWVPIWLLVTRAVGPAPQSSRPGGRNAGAAPSPWLETVKDRRTWAIGGAKALIDQNWWFLLFWIPDLLHRRFDLGIDRFCVPLAAIYLLAGTGSIVAGYASGRLVRNGVPVVRARKLAMAACAMLVLTVPLVLLVQNYWLAVLLLGLTLACHQGFSVNVFALITDIIAPERVGSVVSLGAFCGNLAGMLVLQAAGRWIGGPWGYAPFLAVTAISYLLALLWLHVMVGGEPGDQSRNRSSTSLGGPAKPSDG